MSEAKTSAAVKNQKTTLVEAKEWLRARSRSSKGTSCPCCRHHVKLYKDESSDGVVSEQEKAYFAGYTDMDIAEGERLKIKLSSMKADALKAQTV